MAEIGVVKCASVALRVGQAVLPASRRKFSTRQFTPPQLLAMLCLRRDADWTFRETAVRLAAQSDLRMALGLRHVPDDTRRHRCLRRLDETTIEPALTEVLHQWGRPSRGD
jgi:hypothetical protein